MNIKNNFKKLYKDFICGYCYDQKGYDLKLAEAELRMNKDGDIVGGAIAILSCKKCEQLSVVLMDIEDAQDIINGYDTWANHDDIEWWKPYQKKYPEMVQFSDDLFGCLIIQGQYPPGIILNDSIPEEIQHDLQDVFGCLTINAPNAAVVMSRRVVQQIAILYGANSKTPLGKSLDILKENQKIDDELYEALAEIKNWGDGGAHPGKIENINMEEAQSVAKTVLDTVHYVFPESLAPQTRDLTNRRMNKMVRRIIHP